MKFFLFLLLLPLNTSAEECWKKFQVQEHTQVFTVNLISPSIETDSKKMEIFLSCEQAQSIKINDEIQLDSKTFKFNHLPPHGMMMKKTYTILKKL